MTNQNSVREISIENFNALHENEPSSFQLIDVRNPDEYAHGNLKGLLIPLPTLSKHLDEINRDKDIIVHCQHGVRSKQAAQILQSAGFTNVFSLQGGYAAWLQSSTGGNTR
jgi:rhodanese-related sulfurtransferase